MARKIDFPILYIYIVYNINSTWLAQRGVARLRALQVLPLGHHLHSEVYIWLSHCPAMADTVCVLVLAVYQHLQAQQGMQLRQARLCMVEFSRRLLVNC